MKKNNIYKSEVLFHNKIYKDEQDNSRKKLDPFYYINRQTFKSYADLITKHSTHLPCKALEYGCGKGSSAFEMAKRGVDVVGIDISDVAIGKAIEKKDTLDIGYTGKLSFEVMNAESLIFAPQSFDLVCGSAILHHLNVQIAFQQIRKVLRPGGTAIFMEPLGYNPFINFYRYLTPQIRTPDEHPFKTKDIEAAEKIFRKVSIEYFQLTTIFSSVFYRLKIFDNILHILRKIDSILFKKFPFLKKYAWSIIIVCKK
jgi:SAM-dependent methyltransferase